MTAIKREKIERFVKEYLVSSDAVQAARLISKCKDRKGLARIGREYLGMPEVQDAIEKANTFTLDRDGIARALTEILTNPGATVDQKIKASNALEKLTRYGDIDDKSTFQDDFERFLVDYGDVLEEFMDGKSDNFEKVFRPQMSNGKVTFHIKKNLSHLERKQAMIILLKTLTSRNAFL